MKDRYAKMTDLDFDRILADIVGRLTGPQILEVPGAYEAFSEHFNNEVLEIWEETHTEPEEDEEEDDYQAEKYAHFSGIDKDV